MSKASSSRVVMRSLYLQLIFFIAVLFAASANAAVISSIEQLDEAAVMHFAIVSDNKGSSSGDFNTCRTWMANSAIKPEFVLGLGDNLVSSSSDGFIVNVLVPDTFWHNKFYPNVADGENQAWGSQGDWGVGRKIFNYVHDFWGRGNVVRNPRNSRDSDGNVPDYYCWFEKGGITVHVIQLTWSDTPNDSSALREESRAFMQDKLLDLAALKNSEPGKHIVIVLGHTYNGDFVGNASFSSSRKELLLKTADFCGGATTHRYGWWDKYKTDYGGTGNNAISYNNGACGAAGANSRDPSEEGVQGYVEIHVLENPTRITVQYIDTERSSRKLHIGKHPEFNSYDSGKYGTPIIKYIDSSVPWGEVDWNNIALGAPPKGAAFVSYNNSIPTSMDPGELGRQVSITMKNTGTTAWLAGSEFKLGLIDSIGVGNEPWGTRRAYLDQTVSEGQSYTFTFDIDAPAATGVYDFQWQMVQEGVEWFGEKTPNMSIGVGVQTFTKTIPLATGSDDAEQQLSSGAVNISSSDLEIVDDDLDFGLQDIGVRFQNIPVNSGDTVTKAYIQFTADPTVTANGAASFRIFGENTADSAAFTTSANNISSRSKTGASALWEPAAWTAGASGDAQRTTDLAHIMNEIISGQSGWSAGNDISFVITGSSGTRRAESYDGNSSLAPKLYIEYASGGGTTTGNLVKGPYLIYPGNETSMTVLWQTDGSDPCQLEWGTSTTYPLGSVSSSEINTSHQHKKTITGLTPGTKYYYRVIAGSEHPGEFKTAPAASATAVNFLAYGDTRTNPGDHNTVASRMVNTCTADPSYQTLLLHVGDFVENGTSETDWTEEFFPRSQASILSMQAKLPIMGTMGNHEGDGALFKKYFPYPFVADRYYSFDYGPVHVSVVDQCAISTASDTTAFTLGSTQYNWLVNDLANTPKKWKVIVLHHPGWSAGGSHENNNYVMNTLHPLFKQQDVAVVFGGHNHYYARAAKDGIHYITTGGGGAPENTPNASYPNIVTTAKALEFCKVQINGDQLACSAVNASNGSIIDQFSITKSGGLTTVPNVLGQTEAAARSSIESAGLVVSGVNPEYNAAPAGTIFSQTPGGGTTVDLGSPVALAVSLGSSQGSQPGLWYGTVAGNINTTDPNPKTSVTTSLSETEDAIAAETTEVYTGQIYDADGHISFTEDIDDKTRLYIDGTLVLNSDVWSDRTTTADLNLTPGWHDFELRISNGGGGSGPHSAPGFGYDPNGGTSWVHPADPGNGTLFRTSDDGVENTQDFSGGTGMGYTLAQYGADSGPTLDAGALTLLHGQNNQRNNIAFDCVMDAPGDGITLEWDFSIGTGADGYSVSLLNTGTYGLTGAGPSTMGETPTATDSLGVGFDIYPDHKEITVYWNGIKTTINSPVEYRTGSFMHAKLDIEFTGSGAELSLTLNGTSVLNHYVVAGATAYKGRAAFAARTGGLTTICKIDNVVMTTAQQTTVTVPNVLGQTEAAATSSIEAAGLVVGGVSYENNAAPAGTIFSQTPGGGLVVDPGSSVDIAVSLGAGMVTVPNVLGQTEVAATSSIEAAGLVVGGVSHENNAAPSGTIFSQTPGGGASVASGSTVNLAVSLGAAGGGDIIGKLTVGYQGWFACAGDNSPHNKWKHWNSTTPSPGNQTFELWPDCRDYEGLTTLYQTGYADLVNGQPAKLFSSYDNVIIDTHVRWMQEYGGIDTIALQRFGRDLDDSHEKAQRDGIADKIRNASQTFGRKFYIMYDITNWDGDWEAEMKADWLNTITALPLNLTGSDHYAMQDGKPVVGIWGINKANCPGEPTAWNNVITWFQAQGCYVIIGIPIDWRDHSIAPYETADMLCPWSVGEYRTETDLVNHSNDLMNDKNVCDGRGQGYIPVVFPGYSYNNSDSSKPKDEFPRNHGDFMWRQFAQVRDRGISTVFVAMFDEYDEATAIAKAADSRNMTPPEDNQWFLTLDANGVACSSDFYLRLTSAGSRMIKGETGLTWDHLTRVPHVLSGQVSVPNVVGQTEAAARSSIISAGLVVGGVNPEYNAAPVGTIFSQTPGGGALVDSGSTVNLAVSLGVEMATVPNVVGQAEAAAISSIESAGLVVGGVSHEYNAAPVGTIFSQTPGGGASVAPGSSVNIAASLGVNSAPTANAQSVTTVENTAKAIPLTGSDPDGDPLTYVIVSQPANGSLSGTAPNVTYTPSGGYSGSDSFTFRVNDGTVNSANATVSITVTPAGGGDIIESENFESSMGSWINVSSGDTHDWIRDSGGTPSTSTGPSAGANGSTWYMYMETSDNASGAFISGESAILEGPNVSNADTLTFFYHMYGDNAGTLNVDVYDGSWHNGVWSISGPQHTDYADAYTQATVNLSAYNGTIKLRFRAVAAGGWKGDIAIDDVEITGSSSTVTVPNVLGQTEAAAISSIESAGLVVGGVSHETNAAPVGTIFSQTPGGGASVAPGSTVNLAASLGSGSGIQAADLVGHYTRVPVENDWHLVDITLDGAGLRWSNAAGAGWSLTFVGGVLQTGADCPYGIQDCPIETVATGDGGEMVTGIRFLGGLYVADATAPELAVTEYYLTTGDFAGTTATVTLNQNLADDYFIFVRGSHDGDGLSMPDNDYARVISVPGGKGELSASAAANQIVLKRAVADLNWEGVVTVVECANPASAAGFRLIDIVETAMTTTSGTDTSATWSDLNRVVLFGGYRGGGVELQGNPTTRSQGVGAYARLYPSGSGTINWSRNASGETLYNAVMTTFVVQWGSEWNVQHVNVAGSAGGDGANATTEYTTAAISAVSRDATWVWGTGTRLDAGIGDCSESCLVTLGNGVSQNATESAVAVGSEYTDAYNFDLYVMTHPALKVDYRFKADGNSADTDTAVAVDTSTAGARFAWVYNGCNGTGDYFPRPRLWARYTAAGTVTISRGFSGQNFPAWIQAIDLSGLNK